MLKHLVAKSLPMVPKGVVRAFARRYVAGDTLDQAVAVVKTLNSDGATATLDYLGEFVNDRAKALESVAMVGKMFDAIKKNGLSSGVSLKLTSLGLDIDDEFCHENLRSIVADARSRGQFVRIDMENSPYTSRTLALYCKLRDEGFENTGVVLQAYMRRSEADLRALIPIKASVRLCKGIYIEPAAVAFKDPEEIRTNYKKLLVALFENEMKPAIATHDEVLLDFACEYIGRHKIPKDAYEFQMLLGVRDSRRAQILSEGHRVRVYVPFGDDWYGYSLRRLKENPEIAGHVMRSFFGKE